ncbi:hypothetical protein [Kitasatospora sp. NPDC057198]|uniref:hypothetical protein n=1 Tax=Kitasatospora sp. NPDC057198 TaxID=3346046 RepID=UPI00362B99C3
MAREDGRGPAAYGLVMKADRGTTRFLCEVVEVLESFGISRAEAVARLNRSWGSLEFEPYPDLVCHEEPEYWAHRMYYADNAGATVPYWDEGADRGAWAVVPAPPDGDPAWTLPREG